MMKKANVDLLLTTIVPRGKYLVMVGGPVADVESPPAGRETAGKTVVDEFLIQGVHPQLPAAIKGRVAVPRLDAVGVIETKEVASAIFAGDAAVKAAEVTLIEARNQPGGKGSRRPHRRRGGGRGRGGRGCRRREEGGDARGQRRHPRRPRSLEADASLGPLSVRPIDPLGPLPMHAEPARGLRFSHIVVLIVLGCVFVWFLVSRANAPEEGGVREVPGGTGRTRMEPALLMAWAATAVALAAEPRDDRMRRETERTLLEYHAPDLSLAEAEAFSALLDRGVADVEALVGPSLPPWARRTGRVRFVVSGRVPISRTRGTTVLLPLERVRTHSAPYLHETVHALVPSRGDRVWLAEGLASYLESWVSENRSGYDAHVFTRAGDRGIHGAAQRFLESEAGREAAGWAATASPRSWRRIVPGWRGPSTCCPSP